MDFFLLLCVLSCFLSYAFFYLPSAGNLLKDVKTKGTSPLGREDFSMTAVENKRIFIFGGCVGHDLTNDMYCLDLGPLSVAFFFFLVD
jgi:hypothetical protein